MEGAGYGLFVPDHLIHVSQERSYLLTLLLSLMGSEIFIIWILQAP